MDTLLKAYYHGNVSQQNTKVVTKRIPNALYKKIHQNAIIVCVDLVVRYGNKFLLVKRDKVPAKGEWFLPGGRVFKNEKLHAAALRKLNEEIGLHGTVRKLLGTGELFEGGRFKGMRSHVITFVFLVVPTRVDHVRLDSQSTSYGWFNAVDARWYPYVKDFLRKAGFK